MSLIEERLRWNTLVLSAGFPVGPYSIRDSRKEQPPLAASEPVVRLSSLQPLSMPKNKHRPINGLGECPICHRHRRLWAGLCAWCAHDPEDSKE